VRVREEFLEHLEQALPTVMDRFGRDNSRELHGFLLRGCSMQPGFEASAHLKLTSVDWSVKLAVGHFATAPESDGPSMGVH
jgi:hypothetical protein